MLQQKRKSGRIKSADLKSNESIVKAGSSVEKRDAVEKKRRKKKKTTDQEKRKKGQKWTNDDTIYKSVLVAST